MTFLNDAAFALVTLTWVLVIATTVQVIRFCRTGMAAFRRYLDITDEILGEDVRAGKVVLKSVWPTDPTRGD